MAFVFKEKKFDFLIPKEVQTAIDNLRNAEMTNFLVDCYLDELRAYVHWNVDGDEGMTEEQGDEIINYYCTRSYLCND